VGRARLFALRAPAVAVAAVAVVAAVAGLAGAAVFGGPNVRASFTGWLTPRSLPRGEAVPVALHMKGVLSTTEGHEPPQLRRIEIAINRHGVVSTAGLPTCPIGDIKSTDSKQALAACRSALVGTGRFTAHVSIPEQAPFPSIGKVLAFNSLYRGRHVILAHIFGRSPVPTTQILVLRFGHLHAGAYDTTLTTRMPETTEKWGYATGFALTLDRRYSYRGRPRSVVRANCPAPSGFTLASFAAAKATYELASGRELTRTLEGRCRVARR
jgi:hypothetical protein